MGRGNQIARQWTLIQWIDQKRQGITIAELARELNCVPRTIYRDLDDLQMAGFPLVDEKVDGVTHWQFIDGYRVKIPTPFNLTELMSLYLSRDLLKSLEGTFFFESIQNLVGKIRAQLGPELINFLNSTEQAFAAVPGPVSDYRSHRELLHLLNEAVLHRETVKFRYRSRKKEQTLRQVNPYKVFFHQGTLYLVGHDLTRKANRMFVIQRISLLQKTGKKFSPDPSFHLEDYLRHSFGVMQEDLTNVSVFIDSAAASFVAEKQWHPSQKVEFHPDGSAVFSFSVAGTKEIKLWVLGMGPLARVLNPPELVEEMVEDLEKALQNYRHPLKVKKQAS